MRFYARLVVFTRDSFFVTGGDFGVRVEVCKTEPEKYAFKTSHFV